MTPSMIVRRRPRALVVSNQPALCSTLSMVLRGEVRIEHAVTADAARALLEGGTAVDVILVDLTTAGAGTIAALRRASSRTGKVPVLALGATNPVAVVAAIEAGAQGYLSTPIRGEALLGKVRSVLRRAA